MTNRTAPPRVKIRPGQAGTTKKSPEIIKLFLDALRSSCTPRKAAQLAGVGLTTAKEWRAADEQFAKDWVEAYDEGTDVIEAEAQRRAVEGFEEITETETNGPKGLTTSKTVARRYSDTLVNLILQGRRPEKYRKSSVELTGPGGGPVRITAEVEFVGDDEPKPKGKK